MSELDAETRRLLSETLHLHPYLAEAIALWESGAPDTHEDVLTLSLSPSPQAQRHILDDE